MANTIALRKAYSTMLDEVYKLASLTAVLDGPCLLYTSKRAEGAIYKRFADNPDAFRCRVVDEIGEEADCRQFRKEDIAVSYTHLLDPKGDLNG